MAAPHAERLAAPTHEGHTVAVAVAVVAGAVVALQQRVNGGLEEALGDALLAAVVSFGSGLMVCLAVMAVRPTSRRALPLLRALPAWTVVGGTGGAFLVVVGATAAPQIGVALLTVGLVGGQTVGGLLVDGSGLGPGGRRPLTAARATGAGLCLAALGVSSLGRTASPRPLLLVLVVLAGLLIAVQQGLNGLVQQATGDVAATTLLNFSVGLAALLVALAFHAGSGLHVRHWPSQWSLYVGGPLGVVFVSAAAALVHRLGVLRLGLGITAGQLLGAIVLDLTVPERGHGVAGTTLAATAVTLVAVAVSGRTRTTA